MVSEIVGIGNTVIDHLSVVTRTEDGWEQLGPPLVQGGGMVGTAVVAAARLGACAEMWSVVGDDYHGQMIRRELTAQGVLADQIKTRTGHRSVFVFIEVDSKTGERTIYSDRAAHPPVNEDVLGFDLSRVVGAKALLVQESLLKTSIAAARAARPRRAVVVADLHRVSGPVAELVSLTDALIVPEWTGEELAGGRDFPVALRKMRDLGPRMPAVTVGGEGCWYWADGAAWHCPAFPVSVVDTTGCGDSFHGAFAYAATRGWDVHEGIRFAAAVAAMKATKLGGRSALPRLDEVLQFMEERPDQARARRA